MKSSRDDVPDCPHCGGNGTIGFSWFPEAECPRCYGTGKDLYDLREFYRGLAVKERKRMIIGVNGQAGSGKDTVADYLIEDHGFVKVSFADPMKRFCREIYGFSDNQLWGPSEYRNAPDKRYERPKHTWDGSSCLCCGLTLEEDPDSTSTPPCYLSPRYALQQIGTEWGRDCWPKTWTSYAVHVARELLQRAGEGAQYTPQNGIFFPPRLNQKQIMGAVIADVRFANEIEALRESGGKLIRVRRPGAGLQGAQAQHASEAEQRGIPDDVFDHVIQNDQDLEYLRKETARVLSRLRAESVP